MSRYVQVLSRLLLLCCSFCSISSGQETSPQDPPTADPSRPTVTNPAHLPPTGYLQFEQGIDVFAGSPNDASSRIDRQTNILQATKIALTKRLLIIAVDMPYAHTSFAPGPQPSNGTGDLLFTGQAVLFDSRHSTGTVPSLSVAYTRRLRAGDAPSNDMGSIVQGASLLTGGNIRKLHYDANLMFNEAQGSGPQRRLQYGQSLALSINPTPKSTVYAEIWHFTQPLSRGDTVGNDYAYTYAVRPNLVLDCGFNHGLTSTATQWAGFAGFTYLLPHRLWHQHQ